MFLRLYEIENLDVYVYTSNNDQIDQAKVIGNADGKAKLYEIYELNYTKNEQFIIVVLPKDEAQSTKFDMQYWIIGTEMSPFVAWLLNCFNSVGGLILLVLMILAVMIPVLYMITLLCCQKQHIDHKQV